MTLVRLRLTLPDGTWGADVSETHPEATFDVLAAIPGAGTSYELVSVQGDDVGAVVEYVVDHETVEDLDVVQCSNGEATVQFNTARAPIVQAAQESGLPIELPFRIADDGATIELVGSRNRLSAFGRHLEDRGVDYDVTLATRRRHLDQLLTDVQEDLLIEAIERGYYDTPRRCTLTELADEVGIAKSTCSETLQRAESSVMKRFAEKLTVVCGGELPA